MEGREGNSSLSKADAMFCFLLPSSGHGCPPVDFSPLEFVKLNLTQGVPLSKELSPNCIRKLAEKLTSKQSPAEPHPVTKWGLPSITGDLLLKLCSKMANVRL